MESWGVVFLGVIALSAIVQIVFLVALLVFGRKLARRLDVLQTRLDRELSPALGNFSRVSRAAAEIADLATVRARRLDLALGSTMDRIGGAAATVQHLVAHPLKPIAMVALFKAFREAGTKDIPAALSLFQKNRLPPMKKIWDAANVSIRWYEEMDRLVPAMTPVEFAYSYMTRTGRVDHAEVRRRDPRLAAAYEKLHPEVVR